jgi:hypothetical protein
MKNKKSILKGRASAVFLIAVTAIVCVAFFILGIRRMQNIYSEQMYVTELETRKQSLSDSVNNFIATIDLKRSEADEYYTELMTQSETKAKEYAIAYGDYGEGLSNYFDSVALCDCFSYIIIDASTNQVLYAAGALSQIEYTGDVDALTEGLAYSTLIKNGNISCVYGISKDYVETKLLNELAGEIKVRKYQDGEYLWIERIDNLEEAMILQPFWYIREIRRSKGKRFPQRRWMRRIMPITRRCWMESRRMEKSIRRIGIRNTRAI